MSVSASPASKSSWFRGIKGRLLFSAFLPVIGSIIIFAIAESGLNTVTAFLENSHKNIIPNIQALGEMRQARNKFGYQVWAALAMTTPEKREERLKYAHEAIDEMEKAFTAYESTPFSVETEKIYNPIKASKAEYFSLLNKVVDLTRQATPEAHAEVLDLLNGRVWELGNIVNTMSTTSIKYYNDSALRDDAQADVATNSAQFWMATTTAVTAFAIFGILLWLAHKISQSVGSIAHRLSESNTQVAAAVVQLNGAGNNLSQSSTAAAASLEETVAALEEMTSMVKMNSDNAKQAAALSASSRDAAETGEQEIQTLIESMTEISKSSKKIEEIISVIDDIAFQTNLLALNAAVEAARAGEQGKGFAVVAEAVRALAQRSAAAAKDITGLIKDSVAQIGQGSQIADKSGAVLSNIVNSVKKVSDLNNEIAAASSEQTTGIQQIGKAMNQLDQSSQSNAASAEEIAATSSEISSLAHSAQNLTLELNDVILGSNKETAVKTEESQESRVLAFKTSKAAPPVETAAKSTAPPPAKKASGKTASQDIIPFEEDEPRSRVGTTDGF
ncbi:MAG: methyl-accepting chemotaxis protein [Bdellovibrio sp.]